MFYGHPVIELVLSSSLHIEEYMYKALGSDGVLQQFASNHTQKRTAATSKLKYNNCGQFDLMKRRHYNFIDILQKEKNNAICLQLQMTL